MPGGNSNEIAERSRANLTQGSGGSLDSKGSVSGNPRFLAGLGNRMANSLRLCGTTSLRHCYPRRPAMLLLVARFRQSVIGRRIWNLLGRSDRVRRLVTPLRPPADINAFDA